MTVKRVALFVVATLALWYLGNFALRIVWAAFDLPAPSVTTQVLNLALVPVAAVVAWAILRRVTDDGPADAGGSAGPDGGGR
ncbi:MAG TPA: hypothetical protein VF100_02400 [Thermoanaerobaculia bacterium]